MTQNCSTTLSNVNEISALNKYLSEWIVCFERIYLLSKISVIFDENSFKKKKVVVLMVTVLHLFSQFTVTRYLKLENINCYRSINRQKITNLKQNDVKIVM